MLNYLRAGRVPTKILIFTAYLFGTIININFYFLRPIRSVFISGIITLLVFGGVVVVSCKNKCGSTTCQNGGTCTSNICVCPAGFSGNACQYGWSDVFVGTYQCSRNSCNPAVVGGDSTWQSAVVRDATNPGYSIDIENFDNSNTTVVASVDSSINGESKLSISTASGSYGINASGLYNNGVIQMTFTTSSVGGVGGYQCKMVMTKL